MKRLALTTFALGLLLGWLGGRNVAAYVTPGPDLVYLSSRVQCGGLHEVSVPMAENVRWGVQTGNRWWQPASKQWGLSARWKTGPGTEIVAPAPDGVRLVIEGFKSGNVAGTFIRAVRVKEDSKEEKKS